MDLAFWLELALFILLLLLSGFFSSSETAMFSLNSRQLEQMRRDRNPRIGLILNKLHSVPTEGTEITDNGISLKVHRSSAQTIREVRIRW